MIKCPKCGSKLISEIIYGFDDLSGSSKSELRKKGIFIGKRNNFGIAVNGKI